MVFQTHEEWKMGPTTNGNDGLSSMQKSHRTRLEQIRTEAISLAGTAVKISQAIDQTLDKGGMAHIQPQMAFITSAWVRMIKDWGVVEYLQALGTAQRKSISK